MRRWTTVGVALIAIVLALGAAVWAIHDRGRHYPHPTS